MSKFSRMVLAWSSFSNNIELRRKNYTMLRDAFKDVSNCCDLAPELPEGVVPYAFPLLLERPDPAFRDLRRQGLPIMRWDDLWSGVDEQACPVSVYYSQHLIQIPCHQELTEEEIQQMILQITAVIG